MSTHDVDHRLTPLPDTGYVYRTAWRMATGDVGGDLNLRLDGVARYIQEVGAENLVDAGEAEEHPHWLVQRTVIDVIEPIGFPNEVTFSRWCSALSLRWCTMRVDLVGSDGGRIETEGFWIAMNAKTLTPQRATDSCWPSSAPPPTSTVSSGGRGCRIPTPSTTQRHSRCAAPTSTCSSTSPTPPTGTPSTR